MRALREQPRGGGREPEPPDLRRDAEVAVLPRPAGPRDVGLREAEDRLTRAVARGPRAERVRPRRSEPERDLRARSDVAPAVDADEWIDLARRGGARRRRRQDQR